MKVGDLVRVSDDGDMCYEALWDMRGIVIDLDRHYAVTQLVWVLLPNRMALIDREDLEVVNESR
jgi:heat shock protein HspQ